MMVKDAEGNACSNLLVQQLDEGVEVYDFNIPIIKDCDNVVGDVTIEDGNGLILDRKILNFYDAEYDQEEEIIGTEGDVSEKNTLLIVLFVIFSIIFLFGIYMAFNNKRIGTAIFLLLISCCLMFFIGDTANADTINFQMNKKSCGIDNLFGKSKSVTITTDRTTCLPGGQIKVTGSSRIPGCTNKKKANRKLSVNFNGKESIVFESSKFKYREGSVYLDCPTSPGTYYMNFDYHVDYKADIGHDGSYTFICRDIKHSIKITVPAPSYQCTGDVPDNAILCSGDDQGLPVDTLRSLKTSCGESKCEYTCASPYMYYNGQCVRECSCGPTAGSTCNTPLASSCDLGQIASEQGFPRSLKWNCSPVDGQCGKQVQCQATKPALPSCNYGGLTSSCNEPDPDCNNGTASLVQLINNDTKWQWTCTNSCNESISCEEMERRCPFIEVNP